jgi:hypothetical protein
VFLPVKAKVNRTGFSGDSVRRLILDSIAGPFPEKGGWTFHIGALLFCNGRVSSEMDQLDQEEERQDEKQNGDK